MEVNDCLSVFILANQQNGKIVMRVGLLGLDPKSFFKLRCGPLQISKLGERDSQVHASAYAVRLCRDGLTKLICTLCIPLGFQGQFAANQVDPLSLDESL